MEVSVLPTRIAEKILESPLGFNETPCWVWLGYTAKEGYGQVYFQGKLWSTHRLLYELFRGPIPEGLHIDHLCRVRGCCNPAHLEAVTCKENARRGDTGKARGAQVRAKTHCPGGHKYSPENTHIDPTGSRRCRECNRLRCASRKSRKELV